ncbi:hypothetical protein [Pseudonocardia sp.]|nr:hypothetical protein [Pseudonocardia sp.]
MVRALPAAPDQYARLVGRGWSHERVEAWFAGRLRDLLHRTG